VRRKKKKDSELSGLLLERGPDSDDLTDDEDHGDMKCHCKVRSNQIQETQDFEPRNVLTPDEGWTVIQVSAGNVRQTIESAIESSDIRVSIQYPSGWNSTGQVVSVEQGLCDHLRVYKGWVWVRLVEEGETTKSEHLCALDVENYGMDSQFSWCMLRRDDSSSVTQVHHTKLA